MVAPVADDGSAVAGTAPGELLEPSGAVAGSPTEVGLDEGAPDVTTDCAVDGKLGDALEAVDESSGAEHAPIATRAPAPPSVRSSSLRFIGSSLCVRASTGPAAGTRSVRADQTGP